METRHTTPLMGFRTLMGRDPENRILPFLWVHGEDAATYRRMVQVIHEANIGAFCIEARPHPDFCGPGWWRDVEILLQEAEKFHMKVWILDDKHFPTGYAGGAVKHAPLSLRKRYLTHCSLQVPAGGRMSIDVLAALRRQTDLSESEPMKLRAFNGGELPAPVRQDAVLSCVGIGPAGMVDLSAQLEGGMLRGRVPDGVTSVELCGLTYDAGLRRDYINVIDEDSCKILIDAVYEPHYAHFGDRFGTVIAGFFSDEPELGNGDFTRHNNVLGTEQSLPWSSALAKALEDALGPDGYSLLPLLWVHGPDASLTARVRYVYMDCVTRLVQRCFSDQIGSWCRAHGVEYIGHIIEDNNQHARTSTSLGHFFRCQRGQDMSGIDDIGGHVMPGGEDAHVTDIFGNVNDGEFFHYALGKLGASAAAITPSMHGRAMCEIFGNYKWREGIRLEKYLLDHFLVRGINHFVPHAFTCGAYPDPDCPPHFYAQGNNPQYRHFGALMAYANRMTDLLSGGTADAPVAILYHGEGEWSGEIMLMQKPARVLADRQADFLFVPSDVFSEREAYKTKTEGEFSVNGCVFRLLIVPYTQFIPAQTAQAIAEMPERVFFIDALPQGTCTGEKLPEALFSCRVVPLDALGEAIDALGLRTVQIDPANDRIRVRHTLGNPESYLIANEGQNTYRGAVELASAGPWVRYDAWSDVLLNVEGAGRRVEIELAPAESLLLVRGKWGAQDGWKAAGRRTELWNFTRSVCRAIEYPNFRDATSVSLPDAYDQADPRFSGLLRYETALGPEIFGSVSLEITDAGEAVEVFVNGVSCGIRAIPPFRYALKDVLTDGTDQLRIEVATTPERELSANPDGTAPTGLTGRVYLYQA